MSMGDILAALADKGTLDLTKTDTTAIRNTLGEFSGGGIEDTVVKKLLELEGRINEIAARQNYTDDDFYIECGLNYTSLSKSGFTSKNDVVVLDVAGCGTIRYLSFARALQATIYIDNEIFVVKDTTSSYYHRFGTISHETRSSYLLQRILTNVDSSSEYECCAAALNFKKSFRVVVSNPTGDTSNNSYQIIYGIGGAAV